MITKNCFQETVHQPSQMIKFYILTCLCEGHVSKENTESSRTLKKQYDTQYFKSASHSVMYFQLMVCFSCKWKKEISIHKKLETKIVFWTSCCPDMPFDPLVEWWWSLTRPLEKIISDDGRKIVMKIPWVTQSFLNDSACSRYLMRRITPKQCDALSARPPSRLQLLIFVLKF